MNLAFLKNKLKNIVLPIALFTPFFISGCYRDPEERLKIENIQSHNSEYTKKYEGKVERFYIKNVNSYKGVCCAFHDYDSNYNKILFFTEVYLDNGGFYILDGKMNIKNGEEMYSFKADLSKERNPREVVLNRTFLCTKDNNCLIDVYFDGRSFRDAFKLYPPK